MRRLGAQLRKIRVDLGLTLDEAAGIVNISKSALNRIENAHVITRRHEVDYITLKYGVTDVDLRASLMGLAAAGRSKDWIKRYGALVPGPAIGDTIRLEQDSTRIRTFQPIVIPGLLQTPEYARTIMLSVVYDPARDVDRSVAFRMARQEVLTRPQPAVLEAVIGEAALRQRQGDAEVMRGQLRHLLEMSRMPNVTVRVLPFNTPRSPGVEGPFNIFDVETGEFTTAVLESLTRSVVVEDDTEVDRYIMVFNDLCALGLTQSATRAFIERVLNEWEIPLEEVTP